MSNQLDLPNWRPGSLIRASWLQKMVDAIRRNRILIGQNSGIEYRESPHGTLLSVKQAPRSVGITASTITAATVSSGVITYGSGTVTRQIWTGGGTSTASDTVTVYNFSTTTGGIASGTNCWIEQDNAGIWWILAVDCGN